MVEVKAQEAPGFAALPARISGRAVLDAHVRALAEADPRLVQVLDISGEVPLRLGGGGFPGMAQIVISQLLSVASANAIHRRFEAVLGEVSATRFLEADGAALRAAGLSGGKIATLAALAEAERAGALDYQGLAGCEAEAAIAELVRHRGIGRWTAEIYLLFCTGHPDIFPAGDLVLRKMAGHVHGHEGMPDEKETRRIAERWAPWRGTAARLLWRYYAALKQKEGIAL